MKKDHRGEINVERVKANTSDEGNSVKDIVTSQEELENDNKVTEEDLAVTDDMAVTVEDLILS